MLKAYAKSILRPAWGRLRSRIESIATDRTEAIGRKLSAQLQESGEDATELKRRLDQLDGHIEAINGIVAQQRMELDALRHSIYAPDPTAWPADETAPFMQFSNCQSSDFYHPRYQQLCKLMAARPFFHRKQWEFVYILHQLAEAGMLRPGMRGLGFGVGTEPLPAVFASMGVEVTATDAPVDLEGADGWHAQNQHSDNVSQLFYPDIAPNELVRAKVSHRPCDMNHIDPSLTGYDFNWSSCCFEHLGTIDKGLAFVVNAVEKTLKVSGVAVHTTEYNASSNHETVMEGGTVIFRLQDMERLGAMLRARGHEVQPFLVGPTAHALDFHVDVPPYRHNVHLKLLLAGYVSTSVGIVVRRGR